MFAWSFLVVEDFLVGYAAGSQKGSHLFESSVSERFVAILALTFLLAPSIDMPVEANTFLAPRPDRHQFHLLGPKDNIVEILIGL